jgi:cytochrome c-type biogenesis protein CcmH
MIPRFAAVVVAALALAGPAAAASCAHPRTSLSYLEGQVMCPVCHTTLDQSDSAAARQIEVFISKRIAQCWTAQRIESALVANYGAGILAAPPRKGFDLLAWWLPIVGVLGGALVLAAGVWRWSRGREPDEPGGPEGPAGSGLDEETERRLDDLLARFD